MTTKIITAQELRSGNIELPASGGAPDFSAAALADARIVPLQGGQSVDLRGLIEPGATLGWQGPNLVVVSPSGEMVVLQDFLSLVGNAAIMTLQVGSREPGAAVQTLVLAQHDNKLVWQSTFLSTLAWQEATLKSASVLRATVAPVAYKTPDEVVMHETAFKSTRAIDMLRLLETAVAPLASALKTSPEQLAAPLADGGAAGDSGFLTDAPPTAEILIAPDVSMALYEASEVSTPVAANGVPVTGADTLRVKEGDGASTVQVLDNDYDPEYSTEPGTQSLTLLSAVAAHGRVTFTADGVVSYQPDPDFSGTDEVVYQVRDRDGMVSEGRVQVTVEGVNDLPTLQMPAAQTAGEDQALALSGLSVKDPDSVLTVTLQVAHGRLDVQGFSGQSITGNGTMQVVLRGTADQINAVLQAASGLTYTPATDFNGTDALNMVVADELGQTSSSLPITVNAVNDAPARTSGALPAAVVVNEDGADGAAVSLGLTGVTYGPGGGADEASQTLTYKIKTVPAFMTLFKADGTTPVLAGDALTLAELQGLTYKTVGDANGTGQLEWTVQDSGGGGTSTITESLTVTVNAVNDAPARTNAAAPAAVVVNEDSANGAAVSLGLTGVTYGPGGGTDEAGQTLTYKIKTIPAFMTLFKADGTTPVLAGDALTLAELQGLTYKTVGDANGAGQVEWTVQDSGGGSTSTITESLAVTVNAVNDAPVRTSGALPSAIVVDEDSANTTAVSLGLTGVTYGPGGGADEASQTLTYKIKTIPAFMTLFKADGTTAVLAGDALTLAELQGLTYKTVGDAYGTGQVEWTVQDGGGGSTDTVTEGMTITVNSLNPVNNAPERTSGPLPAAITVDEDSANTTAVSLGLTGVTYGPGGGADEASQTLTYKIKTIPAFMTLFKADGTTPVSAGDALTLAELQGLTYKTVGDANGTGQVEWTVQDSSGDATTDTITESFTVTVNAVNDAPVRTSGALPAAITVDEDSANTTAVSLGLTGVTYGPGGGADEASQTLTYKIKTIPTYLTLFKADGTTPVLAGDALTLAELQGLTYKTVGDASGTGQLEWTVQDSSGDATTDTITESFTVTVNAVNDAPVRTSGALPTAITVDEDSANTTAVSLGLTGVTYGPGGGSDEASQTLTYKIKTIPAFMTLFKADGTTAVLAGDALTLAELQGLTYKTVGDANGTGQVEWTVQDSSGDATTDTITESFTVTVNAVNDAPVRTSGALPAVPLILEDSANTTAVSLGLTNLAYGPGGGADEATQTLTYSITAIPSFLLLFKADGTAVQKDDVLSAADLAGLMYKTKPGESGSGTIEWLVKDDGGGTTDSLPQSLAVKVASNLVVTQDNLEITHTDAAGQIIARDFEWRSGDTLTVKWFDKASGAYLGDQNEPTFDVTRVTVDLSFWGLGVVQATETAPGSGVWAYTWTLSADVSDPQSLLTQVKVQAFGTLPGDTVELHSEEVLVNRMVLGTEDSMVVGTHDADVFVMPETSTSGAVILGGDGLDVLDYRAAKTALTLDVQSDWVTHADLGLTDSFISIEEVWFSRADQTIGVRDSSAAKVTWSTSEGNTVAEIDRDLDGVNDITVVYKGLLLTALEQQHAVVQL